MELTEKELETIQSWFGFLQRESCEDQDDIDLANKIAEYMNTTYPE